MNITKPTPEGSLKRVTDILQFCDRGGIQQATLWIEDIRNLVNLVQPQVGPVECDHDWRSSDSSFYDLVCKKCGVRD